MLLALFFQVELATGSSLTAEALSASLVLLVFISFSGIMISWSELEVPTGDDSTYSTMHGGPHLLQIRKAATKVVRPSS